MEMRLTVPPESDKLALDIAVASGHASKRRAVLEIFNRFGPKHLAALKRRKSRKVAR